MSKSIRQSRAIDCVTAGLIAALGAAGAVVVIVTRALSSRRAADGASLERSRAVRPDGVFDGAESLVLTASPDRCALLLHGFNDTPESLSLLGRELHRRGWTVHLPLLPQHGRGAAAFMAEGNAADWISHARDIWTSMHGRAETTILVGQSMGGAIAAVLAVERPPSALILLAPYLGMGFAPRTLARIWPVWQVFVPVLRSSPGRALRDAAARARSLGGTRFSPRLVWELMQVVQAARQVLRRLTAPTLVIHARVDYRIPSASAQSAFDAIGARDKTLVWNSRGGHVIAADEGREEVIAQVTDWLEERLPLKASRPGNTFDTMRKH